LLLNCNLSKLHSTMDLNIVVIYNNLGTNEDETNAKMNAKLKPKEFMVNEFLTVKLVGEDTIIYVNDESFALCKRLLINVPTERIRDTDELDSIDEAADKLGWDGDSQINININGIEYNLSPETEFWGHCSNLQAWHEHNYDTRLLHSNLAFRLLKKLAEIGDPLAKKIFKEEIVERLNSRYDPVIYYLIKTKYTDFLSREDLLFSILEPNEAEEILNLEKLLKAIFKIDNTTKKLEEEKLAFKIEIKKIIKLQIVGSRLKRFPNQIKSFKNLKYLYLNGNDFEDFPGWNEGFKKLEVLDLSSCDLEAIPESIGSLISLKKLNLFNNYLSELPDSIGFLSHLEELSIEYNDSLTLPDSIGNLKSLKILFASNTDIHKIPETIGNLKSIEELHFDGNKIKYLPESIGRLKSLKILDLNYNPIRILPNSIGYLSNIKKLILNSTVLISIPQTLGNLKNLEVLHIISDKLESLPLAIFDIPTLKEVKLHRSTKSMIPQEELKKIKKKMILEFAY